MPHPFPRALRAALLSTCLLPCSAAQPQLIPGFVHAPLDPAIFTNSNQPGVVALDFPGVTREAGREVIAQENGFILVAGDAHTNPDSTRPSRIVLTRIAPTSIPIALPGGAAAALDAGFAGGAGFRIDDFARTAHSHQLRGMVQQPDGRIVLMAHSVPLADGPIAAGELLFARYLADGTPDASFGTQGVVSLPLCDGTDCTLRQPLSFDLAMEPDGALLSIASIMKLLPNGGLREIELELRRLQATGELDTDFGIAGLQRLDEFPGIGEEIGAGSVGMAWRADGRIALVANTLDFALDGHGTPAVMLLHADGTPDTGFGTGGSRRLAIAPATPAMLPAAIGARPDGRLSIGGMALMPGSFDTSFFGARLTSDGAMDTSFSGDGLVFGNFSADNDSEDSARALVQDARGRLYLVGDIANSGFDPHVGVLRLRADGTPDTEFAVEGLARYTELSVPTGLTNDFLTHERALAATIGPREELVATGSRVSEIGSDRSEDRLLVFRLQREGILADGFE